MIDEAERHGDIRLVGRAFLLHANARPVKWGMSIQGGESERAPNELVQA